MVWEWRTRLPLSQERSGGGIASSRPLPTPLGLWAWTGGAAPALPLQNRGKSRAGAPRAQILNPPRSGTPSHRTEPCQDTPRARTTRGNCGEQGWEGQRDKSPLHGRSRGLCCGCHPIPKGSCHALQRRFLPNKRHVCLQDGSGPKMPPSPPSQRPGTAPGRRVAKEHHQRVFEILSDHPLTPKYYTIPFSCGFFFLIILIFFTPSGNKSK